MTPEWMLQALLAGALLGLGALAAERVAGWLGGSRRSVWAAAILGSLLLPALSLWAPGLLPDLGILPAADRPVLAGGTDALPAFEVGPAVPGGAAAGPAAWWTDPAALLGLGWLAASLAMLCVLGWTYRRLRTARERGVAMELDGGAVRVTERLGPAVVGLLHPAVVVPRRLLDAPAEERRLVLLHEREHVAAGDAWLLFLGTLAVAAMPWCLPLWWQHRRLRAAVETDCDARVLARGEDRRIYGRVLIRTAGSTPGLPLFGPAWGDTTSQLERRIMAMTAKRPPHPLLRSLPLLALAAGVAAAACDVVGEAPSGSTAAPETAAPGASLRTGSTEPSAVKVPHWASDTTRIVTDTMAVPAGAVSPTASVGWVPAMPVRLDGPPGNIRMLDYPRVAELKPGGGAWKAGVRNGDEVLAMNGLDARELRSLQALTAQQPGTRYTLRIRRNGVVREFTAELDPPR
ncbi:MAG TPA: M56 family metallopeptidase [Longimicrobiaceae bacterium]|jgi:hypothetical protein